MNAGGGAAWKRPVPGTKTIVWSGVGAAGRNRYAMTCSGP